MDSADPTWPLFVLAAIQLGDAALCVKPVGFVRDCFDDVGFPRAYWWVFTPIKVVAAIGLVIGMWVPEIGLAACLGLVVYFVLAIGAHVRARDFGRNLFVNAIGMLLLSAGATYVSFVS
ncbi:DoxX family protein [Aeromicrobium sp.]|uniref:DoxX family protein n=1 Tax=Aeromicrobium sp. TaxID=1871063 RepID=UPI003D6A1FF0